MRITNNPFLLVLLLVLVLLVLVLLRNGHLLWTGKWGRGPPRG